VSTTTTVPFSSLGLPDTALGPIFQNPATGKVDPNLPITLATYYNQGTIKLDGYELAYQQSFDFLPGIWSGLGALASFTHVNTSGYDYTTTGGKIINVNTVPKYSYSLTGYYERGPFGVRLSYNYKAKNIIETTNNGSDLQRWHAGAGFLDGNVTYKINDSIEVRLDALNLTNALTWDYFDDVSGRYGDGRKSRMDYAKYNGRTIKFGVRGKF
jgi:iron complex outermembrane recepter protein